MADFVWTDLENAIPGQSGSGSTAVVEPLNAMGHEVERLEDDKVDKETGKGLSTEDYTAEEKAKLEEIETGAEVNDVNDVQQDGESVVDENKVAHIDAYKKEDALALLCPHIETTNTVITDAITHNVIDYTIYGNTVGEDGVGDEVTDTEDEHYGKYKIPIKVTGKNVLPKDIVGSAFATTNTVTKKGITIVKNANGTYIANGTCTETADFQLSNSKTPDNMFGMEENKVYKMSGCPTGGGNNTYALVLFGNSPGSPNLYDYGNGVSIEHAPYTRHLYMRFYSGVTVTNLVFKPQIELGTVATEYEPYKENTANIYLDNPLYEGQSITNTNVPISLFSDTSVITFGTSVQPSGARFKYYQDINKAIDGGVSGVSSVNGKTGVVTITASDVDLGNVNNTSDANKPVSTATQNALDLKQNITDSTLTTNATTIPQAINEVNSIAKGAQQGIAYNTYQAMITAFNAFDDDIYTTGQSIYIVTIDVPDLWISSVESTSSTYTYTTDVAFVTELETYGYVQVGYYRLSALETGKVDLTGYEQSSNKVTSLSSSSTDTQYPSAKCVYDIIGDVETALVTLRGGSVQ